MIRSIIGDNGTIYDESFGMPKPLLRIAEDIFENLPPDEAVEFFGAIPLAIGRGSKDLTRVVWLFLGDVLRHLPPQTGDVKAAVERVIVGMDLLAAGEDWPDANDAATYAAGYYAHAAYTTARAAAHAAHAARVAYAAYASARAAVCATRDATSAVTYAASDTRAARTAEIQRQRDVFLQLLREAE